MKGKEKDNRTIIKILKDFQHSKKTHHYGKEVDIWAAGVVLYALLYG